MNATDKTLTFTGLVRREMIYSGWNTLAYVGVIAAATALYVALSDIGAASVDTTRVLMKEIGFNLQITAADTDLARYQALDFGGPDLPEEYVSRLSSRKNILAQHFVGKLQHTLQVEGYTAVLTGVLGQTARMGTSKDPMPTSYVVPRGEAFLGAAVARSLGKQAGDSLFIQGRRFTIGRILPEYGVIPEDIRIFAHLHDVQEMLDRPGRINVIDALACQCPADVRDIVAFVENSITAALPDVQVQPYYSILLARHLQRTMMRRLQLAVLAAALIVAAAAIWGLTYQNVTGRRHEIGVFCALGFSALRILALFVCKISVCAVVAALLGVIFGRVFALYYFDGSASSAMTPLTRLIMLLPAATLSGVIFSLPPVLSTLLRDPADILGETLP